MRNAIDPSGRGWLAAVFAAVLAAYAPQAVALPSVTVLSDGSLAIPLSKIARDYSRKRQSAVTVSFAPAKNQIQQILDGEAADIFITPKQQGIEELKTQGLVDVYSQTIVAHNRLALAAPVDNPASVDLTAGMMQSGLIAAMGNEPVFVVGNPEFLMEGSFAKEALRNLKAQDELEPYTFYGKDVPEMLEMVAGQRAWGVFYSSALHGRSDVRLVSLLPQSAHRPIHYHAVVIAGDNMDAARKFMEYLKSVDAEMVFRESGLDVP